MNDDQIQAAYERLSTGLAAPPDATRLVGARVTQRRRRRRGVQSVAAAACVAALAGGVGLAAGGELASAPDGPSYAADTTSATPSPETYTATTRPTGIDCTAPPPPTDEPVNLELLRVLTQTFEDDEVSLRVETAGDQVDVAVYGPDGDIRYVLHVVDDGASYRVLRRVACG